MTAENFAYWLQGYNEINGGKAPNAEQWKIIQEHLQLVFNKVTPKHSTPSPFLKPEEITYCSNLPPPQPPSIGRRLC